MVKQESSSTSTQTETNENQLQLAASHSLGGGIDFNVVAADLQPQTGPIYDPMANTEKEDEQESEKEVAAAPENDMMGVRKKLLIPAEEALDNARAAAEVIMKDAMDALQRTKQRVMDILHLHHSTSQVPPPAADDGTKIDSEAEAGNADETAREDSGEVATTEVVHVFSEPTTGIIFPFHQQRAEAVAVTIQSRL